MSRRDPMEVQPSIREFLDEGGLLGARYLRDGKGRDDIRLGSQGISLFVSIIKRIIYLKELVGISLVDDGQLNTRDWTVD